MKHFFQVVFGIFACILALFIISSPLIGNIGFKTNLTPPAATTSPEPTAVPTPVPTSEPTPEPTPAPQKTIRIAGYELPQSVLVIGGVALFLIIICLIAFIKLGKKRFMQKWLESQSKNKTFFIKKIFYFCFYLKLFSLNKKNQ